MTSRSTSRRPTRRLPARRRTALVLAGLGLAGVLTGCAEENQSGDSFTDTQTDEVPVPGEPSASPS